MNIILEYYMEYGIDFNILLSFFGSIIGSILAAISAIILWKKQVEYDSKIKVTNKNLKRLKNILKVLKKIPNIETFKHLHIINESIDAFNEIINGDSTIYDEVKYEYSNIILNGNFYENIFCKSIMEYFKIFNVIDNSIDIVQFEETLNKLIKDNVLHKDDLNKYYSKNEHPGIIHGGVANFKNIFYFYKFILSHNNKTSIDFENYTFNGALNSLNTESMMNGKSAAWGSVDTDTNYYNNLYGFLDIIDELKLLKDND